MTTMDQIHRIRELYYEQDKNLNEIAIIMGCDWRTVRKYVDMEDFSSPPPVPASAEVHESKLDPFKPLIDEWLQADKLAPRKQRHTAKRVFKRLKNEVDGLSSHSRNSITPPTEYLRLDMVSSANPSRIFPWIRFSFGRE